MEKITLALLISFLSSPLHDGQPLHFFVLWNVGQGQWLTEVSPKSCRHFDAGGEFLPNAVEKLCARVPNQFLISHYDWDHLGLIQRTRLPFKCWVGAKPQAPLPFRKRRILDSLQVCDEKWVSDLRFLNSLPGQGTSNETSLVSLVHRGLLIMGDAPISSEKNWVPRLKAPIKYLILGHHGSRNSTSSQLLQHLPLLKMGFVSARHARYGHPHPELIKRFRQRNIPLLRTEEWGHIYFSF